MAEQTPGGLQLPWPKRVAPGGQVQVPSMQEASPIVPSVLQQPWGTGGHWVQRSVETRPGPQAQLLPMQMGATGGSVEPHAVTHSKETEPPQVPPSAGGITPGGGLPAPQPAVTATVDWTLACASWQVVEQRRMEEGWAASSV